MVEIKVLTSENFAQFGVCGYKNIKKHSELQRKLEWFNTFNKEGLRIKLVVNNENESQGMIEYLPGEFAHRPVNAKGYMFIHCLFVGFRKEYKGKGFATLLIEECIREAKQQNMKGVAVVTRKGSFMAKKDIFLKNGFEVTDKTKPDFELLARKFDSHAENPTFNVPSAEKYKDGITVMRSAQCPYSVKNVDAILKTSKKLGYQTRLVEIETAKDAQNTPSPFGTFCIIYKGKVISHHPISNTRFENIIKKELN